MLLKDVELYVFELGNETFDAIGEINQFTSLIWPDKFNGYATFELNAPITPENKALIKEGHVLWCGGDNAAVIEIIQVDTNDEGQKVYKAKGRTLELILTTRIIWGTYNCVDKISSTVMYEIVKNECINPSDSARRIPFLEVAADENLGKKISFQKTGGEVYEALTSISTDSELGFSILFRPRERKLIFKVTQGIDRTLGQEVELGSKLVMFSTDLEDILTSSYYSNSENIKTTALVAGEGEGSARTKVVAGNSSVSGFLRKEVYVDARDLQSEVQSESGTTSTLDPNVYNNMLNDRGNEKLSEHIKVETFEATMRVTGNVQYIYNVDYFKGDKIIIRDTDLGIQVVAVITEVSENYGNEYQLAVTFGYGPPTLIQKIKQQII